MSTFSDSVSAAMARLAEMAGVTITYSRGAETVELTAVPGRTRVDSVTDEGVTYRATIRDYKVKRSELILAGNVVEPARGDEIRETRAGVVEVYRVLPLGTETHREATLAGDWWRIHTRRVGIE